MNKYQLCFFFDYGGYCLWGNDGGVNYNSLPISVGLKSELNAMNAEFSTSLDWDDPKSPSPWTKEYSIDFNNRATIVYEKLKAELGSNYELKNELFKNENFIRPVPKLACGEFLR